MKRLLYALIPLLITVFLLEAFPQAIPNQRYAAIDEFVWMLQTNNQNINEMNAIIVDAKLKNQMIDFLNKYTISRAGYEAAFYRTTRDHNTVTWITTTISYTTKNGLSAARMTSIARFVLTPDGKILKSNFFLMLILLRILIWLLCAHFFIVFPFLVHAGMNKLLAGDAGKILMFYPVVGPVLYWRNYVTRENRLQLIMFMVGIWFLIGSIVLPILIVIHFL